MMCSALTVSARHLQPMESLMRDARPSLASAMYPSLSREAKASEDAVAQQRAELRMRNQQLAADLRGLNQRLQQQQKET
jgi:hypothetical protein